MTSLLMKPVKKVTEVLCKRIITIHNIVPVPECFQHINSSSVFIMPLQHIFAKPSLAYHIFHFTFSSINFNTQNHFYLSLVKLSLPFGKKLSQ